MNDQAIGIIAVIVVFGIVILIIVKGIKFLGRVFSGPVSEQEASQAHINVKASRQPEGPGAGLKGRKGCAWLLWLLVAIGIAYLLIWATHWRG